MRIVFMGTPKAAVPTLERILEARHEIVGVWTQPDKPAGRGNKLHQSPVREFASQKHLPIFQPSKIKTPEAYEEFHKCKADLAIVVAYGRILPESFLKAFPRGCINVHFSLLPKYRGAAPVNWAIANGELETGVTTMQMDAGLDTGDILLQTQTAIVENENAIELMDRLAILGADLLIETLNRLDSIEPRRQDEGEATFAPLLKKEEGRINWHMSAREIASRVRAFQPFPTSYTFFNSHRLTIWSAKVPERNFLSESAGTVVAASGDELIVACGNKSYLQLDEVQLEGKRRLSARDFLNGAKIKVGDQFD